MIHPEQTWFIPAVLVTPFNKTRIQIWMIYDYPSQSCCCGYGMCLGRFGASARKDAVEYMGLPGLCAALMASSLVGGAKWPIEDNLMAPTLQDSSHPGSHGQLKG